MASLFTRKSGKATIGTISKIVHKIVGFGKFQNLSDGRLIRNQVMRAILLMSPIISVFLISSVPVRWSKKGNIPKKVEVTNNPPTTSKVYLDLAYFSPKVTLTTTPLSNTSTCTYTRPSLRCIIYFSYAGHEKKNRHIFLYN